MNHGRIARLVKEARATRLACVTATSLKVFLLPPVFGKWPRLARKGSPATLAEAAAEALVEHGAARGMDLEVAAANFRGLSLDTALMRPILYSNWLSRDYVPVE